MRQRLLGVVFAVATCGSAVLIGQEGPPGVYTAAQVAIGKAAYRTQQPGKISGSSCTDCHTDALTGRNIPGQQRVPPLAGPEFLSKWGSRTTKDLLSRIRDVEPLSDETYLGLVAYILQANGARSGTQALNTDSTIEIRSAIPTPGN